MITFLFLNKGLFGEVDVSSITSNPIPPILLSDKAFDAAASSISPPLAQLTKIAVFSFVQTLFQKKDDRFYHSKVHEL